MWVLAELKIRVFIVSYYGPPKYTKKHRPYILSHSTVYNGERASLLKTFIEYRTAALKSSINKALSLKPNYIIQKEVGKKTRGVARSHFNNSETDWSPRTRMTRHRAAGFTIRLDVVCTNPSMYCLTIGAVSILRTLHCLITKRQYIFIMRLSCAGDRQDYF